MYASYMKGFKMKAWIGDFHHVTREANASSAVTCMIHAMLQDVCMC